jgi:hypothetical protein
MRFEAQRGVRDRNKTAGRDQRKQRGKLSRTTSRLFVEQLEGRVLLSGIHYDRIPFSGGQQPGIQPMDSGGGAGQFHAGPDNLVYKGGPLIQSVQIEPIFIKDGTSGNEQSPAFQSSLDAYFNAITTDAFIPTQLTQYSVPANFHGLGNPAYHIGTGSKGADDADVVFTPNQTDQGFPSIDDSQIRQVIQNEISGSRTAAPTANTLYYVYTPPGDAVTAGSEDSINFFLGYHSAFQDGANTIYYAVMPDESPASPNATEFGFAPLNAIEVPSSHEMAEAITDPIPPNGWYNNTGGEIGDTAANESYTLDSNQVQYLWSNQLVGPGHAPGTVGQTNLFINQLSPPAVDSFTGGPIATFTDPNLASDPAGFTAYAYSFNGSSFSNFWTTTITGGANGVYVVNATPSPALTDGQVGSFATQTGMYLFVYQGANVGFGSATSNPVSVRYQPFTVSATAPLTYNADNGFRTVNGNATHIFRLVENGSNFNLLDNGQLVFAQPIAATTNTIKIGADPNGVNSSLIEDFSGGVFANAVSFDGGTGAAMHTLTGPNTANTWNITGPGIGTVGNITFTHVRSLVGGTGNDSFAFSGTGSVTRVNGGAGTNTLDYSAVAVSTPITVNLQTSTATDAGAISHIQSLVGNNGATSLLVGTNIATVWTVTASNGGTAGAFSFTSMPNVQGGNGANYFKIGKNGGVTGTLNGGSGTGNTLDYTTWATGVTVNLTTGAATAITGGVSGINNLVGGAGSDSLTAGSGTDIIHGGGGNNTIVGGTGNDILIGGAGHNHISMPANGGNSILIADKGASTLTGGNAGDIIIGGYTAYDANTAANNASLLAILGEWTGSDIYTIRIADIRAGISGSAFNSSTVTNVAANVLNGNATYNGTTQLNGDWFWALSPSEIHAPNETGEQVN